MPVCETHRSFVNTWECDENGHMNVQFYLKRFDEAAAVFSVLDDQAGTLAGQSIIRHVRYHRELHAGDSTVIRSGIGGSGLHNGQCFHILSNAMTGEVCTTALDVLRKSNAVKGSVNGVGEIPEVVHPRGLQVGPVEPFESNSLLERGMAIITNHSVVGQHDLDQYGNLMTHRVVSRFTDGAPHIWEAAGVTTKWLNENNNGRVAVEMKVEILDRVAPGAVLRLVSRTSEVAGRTLRIDHQLEELQGPRQLRALARGSVRCLVMNLETRKAVALPVDVKVTG